MPSGFALRRDPPRTWWVAAGLLTAAGCGGRDSDTTPAFYPMTPHEHYEYAIREVGLERTALGYEWITASREALTKALRIQPPYEEIGYLDPLEAAAMGYRVEVDRGQVLLVEVQIDGDGDAAGGQRNRIFLDLFRARDDTLRPHRHEAFADTLAPPRLAYFVRRGGEYVVRVQPELLRGGRYRIRIVRAASLTFPVEGRDISSIRSVFGDPRDGGGREHHGVDIFAPRGTPVVAATDGRVRSTRTGGLGGKVVWLRDVFGQSLYYAHLDRQVVRRGDSVRAGDTLGFVGNTGNARTTPPHLHFGIYSRGPYDPFPALRAVPSTPPRLTADTARVGAWARTTVDGLRLRATPSTRATPLRTLGRYTPMLVVGGSGRWYRVVLPDATMGFVLAQSMESAGRPLRHAELTDGGVLLDRPLASGAVVDSLGPGGHVFVLGSFGGFLYVQSPKGRAGWLVLD